MKSGVDMKKRKIANKTIERSFCPDWCPRKYVMCNFECEDEAFAAKYNIDINDIKRGSDQ